MNALLALSRVIDAFTERVGRIVYWLILVVVLISAANASVRKLFNYSSNSFLEIQWYLFSVIFLFGAGYTLLRNEHVRIDIIQGKLSARAQNWIDVAGILLFLMPMSVIIMWLSWPLFIDSLTRHEVTTAYERGWSQLKNGELLDAAEKAMLEVLVTTDLRLKHQQNIASRRIAIVALSTPSWPRIQRALTDIVRAVDSASPGSYVEVAVP